MAQTIVGIFDDREQANSAVLDLLNSGVPRGDISVVASDRLMERTVGQSLVAEDRLSAGGATDGVLGMLFGLSTLSLPGLGPVLMAGPLAAAISAAVAGMGPGVAPIGMIGAMVSTGFSEEHARIYTDIIQHGGAVVAVATDAILGSAVYEILQQHGASEEVSR